jgi:signal transduction histidine kinase
MSWDWNVLGEAGLQFFGKMSASISHEIKNALAIINESAGLLDDLSLRAERGIPVEPERLKKQAGNILKQIRRADGIIQNMNKFAHSID